MKTNNGLTTKKQYINGLGTDNLIAVEQEESDLTQAEKGELNFCNERVLSYTGKFIQYGWNDIVDRCESLSESGTILTTNRYYFSKNHLGSVVGITDNNGNIVITYEYDSYGNFSLSGSDIGNTRLFTSREYDSEIGLYYFRARYYDSKLGRFISRDPIDIRDDVNLYAYVGSNPINYNDPSGELKNALIGAIYITGEFLVDSIIGIETTGGDDGVTEHKEYSIADEVGLDEETLKDAGYVGTAVGVGVAGYSVYKNTKKGRVDKVLGGAYKDVRKANIGGEVHHIPSASVIPYTSDKGASIWMSKIDHKRTGSYGSFRSSYEYRKKEENLINEGKIDEAFEMGIKDLKDNFGNKYNDGIKQMKSYYYNNLK